MSNVLSHLEPKLLFEYFEAMTKIPRESGNESEIAAYLEGFAKCHGFGVVRDEADNIIITKNASPGYEDAPTVILQAHTDMVCVKEKDLEFDFSSDPIPLLVEGDDIKTKGTTLGADNGIGVAMAMQLLTDPDAQHPQIVALFTTSEETGMDGVIALKQGSIQGDILINLDSEEEGVALASCAGGVNNITRLAMETTENPYSATFELNISGLSGGHSGIDIGKNRANAIKLLGRILTIFKGHFPYAVHRAYGGDKMNAIAKDATLIFSLDDQDVFLMEELVASIESTFRHEYEVAEPQLKLTLKEVDVMEEAISKALQNKLESLLRLTPFGVYSMSGSMPGLVESSNNLGILEQNSEAFILTNAIRSSVASKKQELNELMAIIAEQIQGENEQHADYPQWPFKVESPIRDLMGKTYEKMFAKTLKIDAIHAGLECGFLKEKVGDIDMISIGPNLYDVHTPYERVSIGSVQRVYAFLRETLKAVKEIQ